MRIRKLYQIYDLEAEIVAGHPFIDLRDNGACRSFHTLLSDPNSMLSRYPEHYELRLIAIQDEESTIVTPVTPVKVIATGEGWKQAQRDRAEKVELEQLTGKIVE